MGLVGLFVCTIILQIPFFCVTGAALENPVPKFVRRRKQSLMIFIQRSAERSDSIASTDGESLSQQKWGIPYIGLRGKITSRFFIMAVHKRTTSTKEGNLASMKYIHTPNKVKTCFTCKRYTVKPRRHDESPVRNYSWTLAVTQSRSWKSFPFYYVDERDPMFPKPAIEALEATPRRQNVLLGRLFWAKPILRRFSGPRIGSVGGSCFVSFILFLVGASGVHIGCCLNPVKGSFLLFRFVWWLDCLMLLKEGASAFCSLRWLLAVPKMGPPCLGSFFKVCCIKVAEAQRFGFNEALWLMATGRAIREALFSLPTPSWLPPGRLTRYMTLQKQ